MAAALLAILSIFTIFLEILLSRFDIAIWLILPVILYFLGYRRYSFLLVFILGLLNDILVNTMFGLSILNFSLVLVIYNLFATLLDYKDKLPILLTLIIIIVLSVLFTNVAEVIASGGGLASIDVSVIMKSMFLDSILGTLVYMLTKSLLTKNTDDRRLLEGIQF